MNLITLDSADSTNSYLASIADDAPDGTIVRAVKQTRGRGQRGNSWESEPGKNITLSVLLRPKGVKASEQFLICRAISVAVANLIEPYIGSHEQVAVKWPNDIYVGDQKICGILIENSLTGDAIDRSIAGIGLNVNQLLFTSDAPNPVSLIHLTGYEMEIDPLVERLSVLIDEAMKLTATEEGRRSLTDRYDSLLWRRDGFYPFATPGGDRFEAEIVGVGADGIFTLRMRDGSMRSFAFKEVQFIL